MSKNLAQLLGLDEHAVGKAVAKLEELSGYPSEDNRILSEIKLGLRRKLSELRLDPDDTTPRELYHCLGAHFKSDAQQFGNLISHKSASPQKQLKLLVHLIELADVSQEVWVLKRSVAKDILRRQPPKKLLKHLHYRSIESMLKREDIDELYASLPYVESPTWAKTFYRRHSDLLPADFELRQTSFVAMPDKRWTSFTKTAVTSSPDVGVIALWPGAAVSASHKVGSFLASLRAAEDLKLNSFSLMRMQFRLDFGRQAARQFENGTSEIARIASLPVSWNSIHNYYGHLPQQLNSLSGEPYMQSFNTYKSSPAKALAALHPIFRWWEGNNLLSASSTSGPVSLNIVDNAHNHSGQIAFENRVNHSLNRSLLDELISRYMDYSGVESYILRQLDNTLDNLKTINNKSSAYTANLQREFQAA